MKTLKAILSDTEKYLKKRSSKKGTKDHANYSARNAHFQRLNQLLVNDTKVIKDAYTVAELNEIDKLIEEGLQQFKKTWLGGSQRYYDYLRDIKAQIEKLPVKPAYKFIPQETTVIKLDSKIQLPKIGPGANKNRALQQLNLPEKKPATISSIQEQKQKQSQQPVIVAVDPIMEEKLTAPAASVDISTAPMVDTIHLYVSPEAGNDFSLLAYYVKNNFPQQAAELLTKGTPINLQDELATNFLYKALTTKDHMWASALLQYLNTNPENIDDIDAKIAEWVTSNTVNNLDTLLHLAAEYGLTQTLTQVVSDKNFEINLDANLKTNFLYNALTANNQSLFIALLQYLDANLANKSAIDEKIAEWIAKNTITKLDTNYGDNYTILHLAAQYGLSQTLQVLLSNKKVEIDLDEDSKTNLLYQALTADNPNWFNALIRYMKLNPDSISSIDGKIAEWVANNTLTNLDKNYGGNYKLLHLSAQFGLTQTLEVLLKNDSSVINSQIKSGETALHLAVQAGQEECVDTLLIYDADPNIEDKQQRTPLVIALSAKNEILEELLLGNRAEVTPMAYRAYKHNMKDTENQDNLDNVSRPGQKIKPENAYTLFKKPYEKNKKAIIERGAQYKLIPGQIPTVKEAILSQTYSAINIDDYKNNLQTLYTSAPILQPMFEVFALAALGKRNSPAKSGRHAKIVVDNAEFVKNLVPDAKTSFGCYTLKNTIFIGGREVATEKNYATFIATFSHEATHFVTDEVGQEHSIPNFGNESTAKFKDVIVATLSRYESFKINRDKTALPRAERAVIQNILNVLNEPDEKVQAAELIVIVPETIALLGNDKGYAWLQKNLPELLEFYETDFNNACKEYLLKQNAKDYLITTNSNPTNEVVVSSPKYRP